MRPLICPQCGGKIIEYERGAAFTVCGYCSTSFLIEENKQAPISRPPSPPLQISNTIELPPFVRVLGISLGLIVVIGTIGILMFGGGKDRPKPPPSLYRPPSGPITTPFSISTPTPIVPLLEFGGHGENAGQFSGASAIAVDDEGQLYVADTTLRVQQFSPAGEFVRQLEVPNNGRNYERARYIDKIAVGKNGKLYVNVGGVILVYGNDWKGVQRVVHFAPSYIQDFVVKEDGSMLAVLDDDRVETLLFINGSGGITRRVRGFHTDGIRSQISPLSTASESVRIARAKDGSIYSLYALGALGSYSLSIGDGDLRIAKFSPEGKFLKASGDQQNSLAIFVDDAGRLMISGRNAIVAYKEDGTSTTSVDLPEAPDGFTVGAGGNIYTVSNDKVQVWKRMD